MTTSTKVKGKAKIFTWKDLMKEDGEIDWAIKNLFSYCSVITINGEPGSKKTWAMLDLAVCFSSDKKDWLGFEIVKNCPTLIIDEESGHQRLGMRLRKIAKAHRISEPDITTTCISGFNFRDGTDLTELSELVKQTGARLIIIDTLMDVLAGGDDNASKDISPMYKGLRRIADHYHALIIVIHHNNKNGGYRGSSAIKGSSDLMITVTSKEASPNIDFETVKTRDIDKTKWAAYIHSTNDEFRLRKSGASISKVGKVQEHVISILREHGEMSIPDIENNNGQCSKSSIKGAIYKLIDVGYVSNTRFENKKKYYELTEDGNSYADTFLPIDISTALSIYGK